MRFAGVGPAHRAGFSISKRARLRAISLCVLAALAGAAGSLGFTTQVTPGLVASYTRLYGTTVRERLASWVEFARAQKNAPRVKRLRESPATEVEALQTVNSYFNRIPFVSDQSHWSAEDYWATPAETVSSNGGDCEDFSIAKYFLLKEAGIPIERLRITYVKAVKLNQAHMVLAYYAAPGAEPLILDNLEDRVRPASDRPDLVPVYSFNDEDVVLVRDSRKSNPRQIRAWRDLLAKLEAESRL
jgi:predicted transglutaminase-like cysteine proteinase